MSRSIKNLYPEQYEEFKKSEKYKTIIKDQTIANEAKLKCKAEANYTCAICGAKNNLDAHHILPVDDGGEHTQENLICLCRSCHERVHNKIYKINPDKSFEIIIPEKDIIAKPAEYVRLFEAQFKTKLYWNNGYGYYYFNNSKKTRISSKEIKEKVNFKAKSKRDTNSEYHQIALMKREIIKWSKKLPKTEGARIRKKVQYYKEEYYNWLKNLFDSFVK